ncbi:MAG: glycerophosphodiester phosphodiesterase [Negativicutes bacterium]|jgi:glycerophosphoryl diester phosphodiesterase
MLIIAHRGASGYAPENTMVAFLLAYQQKADGVELDVHLTADGEIVICHDDALERTSNCRGELRKKTLAELKRYDFGSWFGTQFSGEKIPSFAEFWDWFVTTDENFIVNIEIKNGPYIHHGIEQKLLDIIYSKPIKNPYDRIIVSCFHHNTLNKVKAVDAQIKTALLFEGTPVDVVSMCKQSGPSEYIHPCYSSLDNAMIAAAKSADIGVNTWTVNTVEQLEYVKQFNLTGVITNYPDRARAALEK